VNLFPYAESLADHEALIWLWRATRRGEFPLAFADLYSGAHVERREMIKIGAKLEEALLGRGDNQDKGERIGRYAAQVARLLGAAAYSENSPQRQLVAMLFKWADDRRGRFAWDVKNDQLLAIGYIVGAAALAIATSVAVGKSYEAALAEVESDPDWLADMALTVTSAHGLAVSRTDLKDTIRFGMTAHGRLGDWLLPEQIEDLRNSCSERLRRFRSTHNRGAYGLGTEYLALDRICNKGTKAAA
jgi:hypothetical protein